MATPQRSLRARVLLGAVASLVVAVLVVGCSRMIEGSPIAGSSAPSPATTPNSRLQSSDQLRIGNCISVAAFTVVDCAQPHELEVFHVAELPEGFSETYPAPGALLPQFEPRCRAGLPEYVGNADVDASRLREFVYWPSPNGWKSGERWLLCAVVEIGPDDRPLTRTGALRNALRDGLGEYQACSQGPPSLDALRVVRCTEPHQGEAVPGVLSLGDPTDPSPTTGEVNVVAEPHCRRVIDAFLGGTDDLPEVRYSWRYPLPGSWPNGYNSVVCYIETDVPVTGSLRER